MTTALHRLTLIPFLLIINLLPIAGQSKLPLRAYTSHAYNEAQVAKGSASTSIYASIRRNIDRVYKPSEWEQLTVPVVFHALYTDESNRVTEEQIAEQLASLNDDFAGRNVPERVRRDPEGRYLERAVDTKIRFCQPRFATGSPLDLVNVRQIPPVAAGQLDAIKTNQRGLPPLHTGKYLNVWICPLPDGNSGFAQLPGGDQELDGIVIDPRFFGRSGTTRAPYDGGKTLTHLIGNYLGLSPLWGDQPCSDDGINDTPVHNAPNYGSPSSNHHPTCPGNPVEMSMNFMDNTDDNEVYMFTRGQARWMRSVLAPEKGLRGLFHLTPVRCDDLLPDLPLLKDRQEPTEPSTKPLTLGATVYPNPAHNRFRVELGGD